MYVRYFWYVVVHKFWVAVELAKLGLYWPMITHDLSKFSRVEFSAYARKFKSSDNYRRNYGRHAIEDNFDKAWEHHKRKNKHHWQHWVYDDIAVRMPDRYVKEMVADWRAMSRVFGGNALNYYLENRHKFVMHADTIQLVSSHLVGHADSSK